MTILPSLAKNVFVPQDIRAMSRPFQEICEALNLRHEAKSERELIAKKNIAVHKSTSELPRSCVNAHRKSLTENSTEANRSGSAGPSTVTLEER
jgi:hypothetical protein